MSEHETEAVTETAQTEAAPEASIEEGAAAATETDAPAAAPATDAPAPTAPATPTPAPPERDLTPEELIEALEASFRDFNDGDIVEGEIVKIDRDEVLLDIGYKSEGVIPSKELSIRHDVDPNEVVKVGDHVEALVLQKEDKEGRLILSKKRAQYERAWGRIEEVMNSGQTIKGPVIEVVKGGLILDIGLRGFLPASLVDLRRVRDLHPFVGQELEAKIIELDRNRNNVVLSRRAFLEESQSEGRKKFLEGLKKGERRKGSVSSIVNFGAFVDLGGVDGLVHVSELSWKHVDHPQEVVTVGQEVEVEVLDVDLERERVSLSLKATQEDPWKEFERTSKAGSVIEGQVTKLVPFGAFVRVAPGIEGLVHISEISHEHVDSPESVLSVGDDVQAKVIDVDVNRRRVSLSMRQVTAPPPREPEIKAEPEPRREAQPEMVSTIQIPDDILAAVAEADAARVTDPEPSTPVAEPAAEAPSEAPAAEEPAAPPAELAESGAIAETEEELEEAQIEEAQIEEAAAEQVAEEAIDEAIVAEAEGDTDTAEADAAIADEAVEAATEAADEEVSLEAILEDLKRREGRSE
jgi:small subunit ribosomal protein S1